MRMTIFMSNTKLAKQLKNIGLYFITDSKLTKLSVIKQVELAIEAGAKIIQYREKNLIELNRREIHATTAKIRALTKSAGVLFIVNDYVDVAIKANADGVHLGKTDLFRFGIDNVRTLMPSKIIGLSTHSVADAVEAEKLGADYIGVGPIYKTTTKKDAHPAIGIETLREIKQNVKLPIIVIGGINKSNIAEVLKEKPDGVAIISGILSKEDIKKEMKDIVKIIGKSRIVQK